MGPQVGWESVKEDSKDSCLSNPERWLQLTELGNTVAQTSCGEMGLCGFCLD